MLKVHALAKELGTTSKEVLTKLQEFEIAVKNQMAALEDDVADLIRVEFGRAPIGEPRKIEKKKLEVPVAPPPPPPKKKVVRKKVAKRKPAEPAPKADQPAPEAAAAAPKPTAEKPTVEKPEPVRAAKTPPAKAETGRRPAKPAARAAKPAARSALPPAPAPKAATVTTEGNTIRVRGAVVVKDFADWIGLKPNEVIAELMRVNVLASINQRLDFNVARDIAAKHGFELEHEKKGAHAAPVSKADIERPDEEDRPEDMMPRPPVVTFLGHVDHGKTSLLDRIRNSAVAAGESGGITQHIGAYTVEVGGRSICFLDTPGHAAFTAMRARGANLTDIAVIVVAADDGIMPQTEEAIQHARAAGVSIMVAINKTDLATANTDRVRQQLQAADLSPEDWGGETICCDVSAQTGKGIDHLLEMIVLQSDVLELQASPSRRATGYVIEARMEPGMGPTANLLVTRGTLKIGDFLLCGPHCGKVRALMDDHGRKVKSATPSMPVRCLGLAGVPEAGDGFRVYESEKVARGEAQDRASTQRDEQLQAPKKASLESLFDHIEEDEKLELRVVLRADTQGSIEAIAHALQTIKSDKVSLNIIFSGTSNVTENDVMLASASNAIILAFHVGKEPGVDSSSKHEGVEIRLHTVIYELIDEVRAAMTGLLQPEIQEAVRGHAEVRQVFAMSRGGQVAGCLVSDGIVRPSFRVRVIRASETLCEGAIDSLRHFQEEVSEMRQSQECGIRLDRSMTFAEGDTLEFYELAEVEQTL